jgi:hypothetical protein
MNDGRGSFVENQGKAQLPRYKPYYKNAACMTQAVHGYNLWFIATAADRGATVQQKPSHITVDKLLSNSANMNNH